MQVHPVDDDLYYQDRHAWDFVNGLCCGYPLCCVIYFCSMRRLWSTGNFADDFNKPACHDDGVMHYSLCPSCTIKAMEVRA